MAITQLDICNNALDLVGQGSHITSLEDQTKESDLCKRNYEPTIERALSKYNFSFARKDEVIKKDDLLSEAVCLPWKYAYTLPDDLMKVLYLDDINACSNSERIRQDKTRFNFRQYDDERVLVTDESAPFVIHYQALVTSPDLFSVQFTESIEYLLASRIATALIHGTTGVQIGNSLLQNGLTFLQMAADQDAQQGAESINQIEQPYFIRTRYGRAF